MKSSSCCFPLNQSMTVSSLNLFHRLVSMCHGDCDNSCCSNQPMKTLVMGVPITVPKICLKISPSNSKTLLWSMCSTISSSRRVGGAWVSRWSLPASVSIRDVVTSWWGMLEYSPTASRVTMRASGGRSLYVCFHCSIIWRKWVVKKVVLCTTGWSQWSTNFYSFSMGPFTPDTTGQPRGLFLSLCTLGSW